jgi:hypothetical protein
MTGEPGNEPNVSPRSSASGVTVGALTRAAGLTANAGSNSINASNWTLSSMANPGDYYTFTITPGAGCELSLASLALNVQASATGPLAGEVATSADGFASHTASFATTGSPQVTLSATSSSAIEVRIYGYGASSAAGTFRLSTGLTLSGSVN